MRWKSRADTVRVVQFQRRPAAGFHHSLEGYFAGIRRALPADLDVRTRVMRFSSKGILRRLAIMGEAAATPGDVFHVTGDVHFLVLALPRRRSILTVLDCGGSRAAGPVTRAVFALLWLRLPARRAAQVVAISAFTARQVAQRTGVALADIEVIPVSIDEAYTPVARSASSGPLVVLCIGTTPNKNLTRTIEALAGLDVSLRIVGTVTEDQRAALTTHAVVWESAVGLTDDELRGWYASSDVVVFASSYEGFGMPIVEAQAVGRPVVTSARAPMDEVAGGAACLVDPEDVASIRAGVQRVLTDGAYRDQLVADGFHNRERFRPAVAAEAYAQLYRRIATSAPRR